MAELLQGLPPVVGASTRLVVLGSFPGVASLRAGQYYAHPRNHFWPILSALWNIDLVALPYADRLEQMLARGLGLWDVYARCEREGSLDSAIVQPEFNDLAGLTWLAPQLRAVAHNGGESARAMRHTRSMRAPQSLQSCPQEASPAWGGPALGLGWAVHRLPSTSPANASWSFERKLAAWRLAFEEHHIA
jgi:hypoxanthine-DNA glycosylase